MINFLATGWPPSRADVIRLCQYETGKQLLEGDHMSAFADKSARLPSHLKNKSYLICDYPAMISKVSADMLFGEKPTFSFSESESEQQAALENLLSECSFFTTLHEEEQTNSSRGDAVLRVRLTPDRKVVIEGIDPSCYFAETNPDNARDLISHCLAWTRLGPDEKTEYLVVEHYLPYRIIKKLYLLGDVVIPMKLADGQPTMVTSKKVKEEVPLATIYENEADQREEVLTGVPYSLLFHIPGSRSSSAYFGRSEYTPPLISLFDAANNRLTKIDDILDRHVEPILVVPEGTLDEAGKVNRNDLQVFEVGKNQDPSAFRYATWDGQLQAAFSELEKIADLIMKFSECSPALFGEDKAGSIESGIAMLFRFARTEAKTARKRNYWDPVLKLATYTAMLLAAKWVPGFPAAPAAPPTIHWKDGLPQHLGEQATIEAGLTAAGLSSKEDSIMRLFSVDRKTARAIMARIESETPETPEPPPVPSPSLTPTPVPALESSGP